MSRGLRGVRVEGSGVRDEDLVEMPVRIQ